MTRLSNSQWAVWRGILAANSTAVAQEVRTMMGILRSVAESLEAGDELPLAQLFAQATRGAAALERTAGAAPFVSSEHSSSGYTERHDDSR